MLGIIKYANPEWLWALLVLVPMIAYYVFRTRQGGATLQISTTDGFRQTRKGVKYYLRHLPFVLRCVAVALLIVAMARPQSVEIQTNVTTEGIDIVLAVDISSSMLARDFDPDRISAAKEVASNFIVDRPNDRIGLVVFAGESFTQSPLTTDKASLLNLLQQVKSGIIEDGTAIGNGLATAVNRLKESDAVSKVIILLTDGVNNRGQVAPLTAADIASTFGIRVYTIGVGTQGKAPYPAIDMWGNVTYVPMEVEIDEEVLTEIADKTGGAYFRATDKQKLEAIYEQINTMEKSKIDEEHLTRYPECFMSFALIGLLLLLTEFLLRNFWLRQIP